MMRKRATTIFAVLVLTAFSLASTVYAGDAVYTTNQNGTVVNLKIYASSLDVYISGGPQNLHSAGLPDGVYFFQVTDPSGKTLLSTDPVTCRELTVAGGHVSGATGSCPHSNGIFNPANNTTPVQLAPFSTTPNPGGEYKVWLSMDSTFPNSQSKTNNFKAHVVVPTGSCAPSGSLSVLVTGTNVAAYVPKGDWQLKDSITGVSVVSVEGTNPLPTTNPIPTANAVNSCASNSLTGKTVCTANNTDVYVISGLASIPTVTTVTSGGSGTLSFSGGFPTDSGVAMDATNNRAVIGLSISGTPGFQFLDGPGSTNSLESPFASAADSISEGFLIDPIRNLLLSAGEENNDYEIVNVSTSTSPVFYENDITVPSPGELDASAEDCSTGIILASVEFSDPSNVFVANLSSSSATFTAGSPGSWTAPSQLQTLSESTLGALAPTPGGIAVAQGTHTGVVAQEFGGDFLTAIALPTAADSTATTPAISDWMTCEMGHSFASGNDPHTIAAYQSPNSGDAIAIFGDFNVNTLAVVDLTKMLNPTIVPRTVGGHGCASSPLPATVVSFIPVP